MQLPHDVLEIIAGFADIDVRRAMNFPPRPLSLPTINLNFKSIYFSSGAPRVVLTSYGDKCITNMVITHPLDNQQYYFYTIKTFWGGPDGTRSERISDREFFS